MVWVICVDGVLVADVHLLVTRMMHCLSNDCLVGVIPEHRGLQRVARGALCRGPPAVLKK
jgi:hypothetical protein